MRSNILTNYQIIKPEELDTIKIKAPLFSKLEKVIHEKISQNDNNIPVINNIKIDNKSHHFGDNESFYQINSNEEVNKLEWMQNCVQHQNVEENTTIIFKHFNDEQLTFLQSILKKFRTSEIIEQEELYKYIGNTFVYTVLNIDSQILEDVLKTFSKSYIYFDNEHCLKENINFRLEYQTENKIKLEEVLDSVNQNEEEIMEKEKALIMYNRRKMLYAAVVYGGTALLIKYGVPMLPFMAAKQCFGSLPTTMTSVESSSEHAPRLRDLYDQVITNIYNWLKK